jgi:hypothetical protein
MTAGRTLHVMIFIILINERLTNETNLFYVLDKKRIILINVSHSSGCECIMNQFFSDFSKFRRSASIPAFSKAPAGGPKTRSPPILSFNFTHQETEALEAALS